MLLSYKGIPLTAIKLAIGFSSYFEKLSELFMSIGRTCPRHKELTLLFPKSRDLQSSTCNYFVVVVRLCKDVVIFSRQSFLSQLAHTIAKPFEAKFSVYQSELQKLAALVKDEVLIASKQIQVFEAQAQALERKAAFSSRQLSNVFREQVSQDLAEAKVWRRNLMITRLLDTCSTFDHRRAWKQSRKLGTSAWIFDTEEYALWQSKSESRVLSLTGKLGSGKTVLSASAVESLTLVQGSMTAYFFCRFDDSESLEARTIAGSLTRQILEFNQSKLAVDELSENPKLDLENLSDLLLRHWPQNLGAVSAVFVIIDGLDECTAKEIRITLRWLSVVYHAVSRGAFLKIFVSSRQDVFKRGGELFITYTAMSMPRSNGEISDYIQSKLEESLLSGALVIQNPELILKISEVLEEGAQGMFLWVAFQIQTICAQPSDHEILEALGNLPRDLPQTFDRIIQKLFQHNALPARFYQRMFDIISVTYRPLVVAELREALSVDPGDTEWDPSRLVNDIQKLVDSCGGLLVIDEEHLTVHFAHHSISTYLASDVAPATVISPEKTLVVDMDAAKVLLALICLTYLSFSVFEQQVAKVDKPLSAVTTSPTKIIEAAMPGSKLMANVALTLLRWKTGAKSRMDLNFNGLARHRQHSVDTANLSAFKVYADLYWSRHCFTALRLDSDAVCHLKAYNSTTSLFLRNICRTKQFELLTFSAPWLDRDLHAASVLLNIAYNPKYIIPWSVNTILGTVTCETLSEYDIEIESLIPLAWTREIQPISSKALARPYPWTLISFAAALGQVTILASLTADALPYLKHIGNDSTLWDSFSGDYVRAFREASCRADRDSMFELVKGAIVPFKGRYTRATDEWNRDMMYYALITGDEEVCTWLIYSPLHFDLRTHLVSRFPFAVSHLADKMRTLRAESGLMWMEWYAQGIHKKISAAITAESEPLDGIVCRTDIHRGEIFSTGSNPFGFQGALVTGGKDDQAYGLPPKASQLSRHRIRANLMI